MLSRMKFEIEPLVTEMLDALPKMYWTSTTTTFLDPAIGGGQFVFAIERRLREHGHDDENIHNRVFGYEVSKLNIRFAVNKYKLVGQYNKVHYDTFFKMDNGMKFDVVVGNPPFQSTSDGGERKSMSTNLWSKFTQKAFEIVNDNGIVALITPAAWASDTVDINQGKIKLFRDIFRVNNPLSINLHTVKQHFSNVGSTFSSFVIQKSPNSGTTNLVTINGNVIVADISEFTSLPKVITEESISINQKFSKLMSNNTTCAGQMQSKSCK